MKTSSRRFFSLFFLTILILAIVFSPSSVFAHSGRTDSQGGHYNHSTGEYHFHHGYPAHQHTDGNCPYEFDDKTNHSSGSSISSSYHPSTSKPSSTLKTTTSPQSSPSVLSTTQNSEQNTDLHSSLLFSVFSLIASLSFMAQFIFNPTLENVLKRAESTLFTSDETILYSPIQPSSSPPFKPSSFEMILHIAESIRPTLLLQLEKKIWSYADEHSPENTFLDEYARPIPASSPRNNQFWFFCFNPKSNIFHKRTCWHSHSSRSLIHRFDAFRLYIPCKACTPQNTKYSDLYVCYLILVSLKGEPQKRSVSL